MKKCTVIAVILLYLSEFSRGDLSLSEQRERGSNDQRSHTRRAQ